jgi:hypothetical protein
MRMVVARLVPILALVVVLLSLAAGGSPLAAAGERYLDPSSYRSANGKLLLAIVPSEKTGRGSSQAELLLEGQTLWRRELPFTPQRAAIADDGVVVGYALSAGFAPVAGGDLVVFVLDEKGEVRAEERTPRKPSRVAGAEDEPRPLGLVHEPEVDRFAVRIADPDPARTGETWWTYVRSTGERQLELDVATPLGLGAQGTSRIVAAAGVRGTGLRLVHALRADPKSQANGSTYALLDAAGAVVWQIERSGDATIGDDAEATTRVLAALEAGAGIVDVRSSGRFQVWYPSEFQRVEFAVARDPQGAFVITETGRGFHRPPGESTLEIPQIALRALGSVALQPPPAARALFTDLQAFDFDAAGSIRAIDRIDRRRHVLRTIDGDGVLVAEVHLGTLRDELGRALAFARIPESAGTARGNDWWIALRGDQETAKLTLATLDGETGAVTPAASLPDLSELGVDPTVDALAATADGGVVALLRWPLQFGAKRALVGFAADGALRFRVDEKFDSAAAIYDPKDLAITAASEIAVLSQAGEDVRMFDAEGRHLRTLPLAAAFGRDLAHPTSLRAGRDRDLLIFDFGGEPPVLVVDADGAPRAQFRPRLDDGETPETLARSARFGRDAAVWATDGRALFCFTDEGRVARIIGAAPEGGAIASPAAAAIDALGRILVRDDASSALHVFRRDGTKALVARPLPADRVARRESPTARRLLGLAGGDLLLPLEAGGYLRFAGDGRRLGVLAVDERLADARDAGAPGAVIALGDSPPLARVGADAAVTQVFDRFPDGMWLRDLRAATVSSDGRLVVVGNGRLAFLGPDAASSLTLDLPRGSAAGDTCLVTKDWIVFGDASGDVTLCRRDDGAFFAWKAYPGPRDPRLGFAFGVSESGAELWVVELPALAFHRFALP